MSSTLAQDALEAVAQMEGMAHNTGITQRYWFRRGVILALLEIAEAIRRSNWRRADLMGYLLTTEQIQEGKKAYEVFEANRGRYTPAAFAAYEHFITWCDNYFVQLVDWATASTHAHQLADADQALGYLEHAAAEGEEVRVGQAQILLTDYLAPLRAAIDGTEYRS